MPRILVKGGIWKNTEDEILKVAVMKYGKNQWSRIASLLHKKTAKQCKTRWYEWLDPHIKKTEWSRDEDEKLLHLAKLMPTQWRTIAPIVGRTAAQCLERYEYLLDKVQEADGDATETADVSDPRKLKPGEIDPNPESKPAKPDAIDMDEDELEMLSEARARLANTQGKKAKRKARERQLDEARRLSSMQKRRELLAAGIQGFRTLGRRKLRTFIDYTKEVPFERKAPQGFFDADEDQFNKADPDFIAFRKNLQRELYDKNENILRKKDKEKQKRKLESDPELAMLQVHGSGTADEDVFTKRAKLTLPEPQVGDEELGQVVKIGMETQQARDYSIDAGVSSGNAFDTRDLLADYSATPGSASIAGGRDTLLASKLRTPSTVSRETNILNEARNIIALNNVQTPLVGGVNTELDVGKVDFSGVTPKVATIQTPNTVLRPTHSTLASATNASQIKPIGATPNALPESSVRDHMGINVASLRRPQPSTQDSTDGFRLPSVDDTDAPPHDDLATPSSMVANYVKSARLEKKLGRLQLRTMLDRLPKPEDDFEIVIPDKSEPPQTSQESDANNPNDRSNDLVRKDRRFDEVLFSNGTTTVTPSVLTVTDSADLDDEKKQLLELERKKRLSTLSTLVQNNLPHPLRIPLDSSNCRKSHIVMTDVDKLVQEELCRMMDNILTNDLDLVLESSLKPLSLTQKKFRAKSKQSVSKRADKSDISYSALEKAKQLVDEEWENGMNDGSFDEGFSYFSDRIDQLNNSIMLADCTLVPSESDLTLECLRKEFDHLKAVMNKYSQKVAKNQTKLEILVGGYQRNIINYSEKYMKLLNEYNTLSDNRQMFASLLSTENQIVDQRLAGWKSKLHQQKQLQQTLQHRYLDLSSKIDSA